MPFAIDEDKLNSPNNKVMDINHPPIKSIPHESFPKMVFAHPKDKAQEHRTKIVQNDRELTAALKSGWKTKPHIPEIPLPVSDPGEYEVAS